MPADLPPNLPNVAASAIVRQAEPNTNSMAGQQKKDAERRRQEALRAASNKRTPGASQR